MNNSRERPPTFRDMCNVCCCKQTKNTTSLELVPSFGVADDQYELVVEKLNVTLAKTALTEGFNDDRSITSYLPHQESVSTQKKSYGTVSTYYAVIPAPHAYSTSRQLSLAEDTQCYTVPKIQRLTKLSEDTKEEAPSALLPHTGTPLVQSQENADVQSMSTYYDMVPKSPFSVLPHTETLLVQSQANADTQSMSTYYDMVPKSPSAALPHTETPLVQSQANADIQSMSTYYDMVPKSDSQTYFKKTTNYPVMHARVTRTKLFSEIQCDSEQEILPTDQNQPNNLPRIFACKHAPSTMIPHFTTTREQHIPSRVNREEIPDKRGYSQAKIKELSVLNTPRSKIESMGPNPKLVPESSPGDESSFFAMVPLTESTVHGTSTSKSFPGVARPQARRAIDGGTAEDTNTKLGATEKISVMYVQSETNPFVQGPPDFVTMGRGRLYPVTYNESQQMHQYLNRFSSVFTHNLKDPIPKDPETLPGNPYTGNKWPLAESISQISAFKPHSDVTRSRQPPVTKATRNPQAAPPSSRQPPPRPPPLPSALPKPSQPSGSTRNPQAAPPTPRQLPPPPPPLPPALLKPSQPSGCPYVSQRDGSMARAQDSDDSDSEDNIYETNPSPRKRCTVM